MLRAVPRSLLALLLVALAAAAPAAATFHSRNRPSPPPPVPSPPIFGSPFSCPNRGAAMQGQPYFNEIINDPRRTCASGTPNNACPVQPGCAARCEACDLYVRVSWNANQASTFTQSLRRQGHQLVVPVKPCRGAEDAARGLPACGYDPIFDYAAQFFDVADRRSWGEAVNPTTRRGQHQLHVHVARLQPTLVPVLIEVANRQATAWGSIVCPTRKVTRGCSYNPDPAASAINVRWVNVGTFAAARPIELVYPDQAAANANTLVLAQPTGKGVVVVRATDRQAECFLTCGQVCEAFCK